MAPCITTPATLSTPEKCEKNWDKFGVLLGGLDCNSPTASLMGVAASVAAFHRRGDRPRRLEQIVLVTVQVVAIVAECALLV